MMAPTGRPRKGLRRDDAAIDAMRTYGLNEKLVNSTVKELPNVYGEIGGVFIEENPYTVLVETILEKVEEQSKGKDCHISSYASTNFTLAPSSHINTVPNGLHANEALPTGSQTVTAAESEPTVKCETPKSSVGSSNVVPSPASVNSKAKAVASKAEQGDEKDKYDDQYWSRTMICSDANHFPQQSSTHPSKKRKPFHGNDELNEPTPATMSNSSSGRLSWWEIMSEDMNN